MRLHAILCTQTYLLDSACWFEHMSLDEQTGLDPEGIKIRAAQGLESVDFFIQVSPPAHCVLLLKPVPYGKPELVPHALHAFVWT